MKYFLIGLALFSSLMPIPAAAQSISPSSLLPSNGWTCEREGISQRTCTHTDGRVARCIENLRTALESCTVTGAAGTTGGAGAPPPAETRNFVQSEAPNSEFVPLTSIPAVENINTDSGLTEFFNYLYVLAVGAAAIIAVLQFVRAGIMYAVMDTGVVEKREAKHLMLVSVMGLLLVLSPALVFGVINPDILSLRIGENYGSQLSDVGTIEKPDGSTVDDELSRLCAVNNDRYTDFSAIVVPDSSSLCVDVKGRGWVTIARVDPGTGLMSGDGACCWGGDMPPGQGSQCCAYDPSQAPPPQEPQTFFHFEIDYVRTHSVANELCVSFEDVRFTSSAACLSDLERVLNKQSPYDGSERALLNGAWCGGVEDATEDVLASDASLGARARTINAEYETKVSAAGGRDALPSCDEL